MSVSTLLPPISYELSVDVEIEEGNAGIVFMSAEPATFYRLLITRQGTYTIQMQDGVDTVINIFDWQSSTAIKRGADEINRLKVERRGVLLRFFANDQLLTDFLVPRGPHQNRSGFVLTSSTGHGHATFDNLIAMRLSGAGDQ